MHEKKEKGDIGVAFTIARLTELGWSVCIPLKEHTKYDLIVEKDGICQKIQVRFTTPKNGKLEVKLRSIWSDSKGAHYRVRQVEDFDILAVFCPSNKKVYFLQSNDFENDTTITLRLESSKNNQKKGIRMAENFLSF